MPAHHFDECVNVPPGPLPGPKDGRRKLVTPPVPAPPSFPQLREAHTPTRKAVPMRASKGPNR